MKLHLLVCFAGLGLAYCQTWLPRPLGSFYLKDVGFIEAFETQPDAENYTDRYSLYFTTFNAFAVFVHDPVYRLRSPGKFLEAVETWDSRLEKLGGKNTAYWPNQPTKIPREVAGFEGMLQTSGFLVPGKTNGQLEVYNEETLDGPWDIASQSDRDWSYHWVLWHDVDNDGLPDVMTARFHVNLLGGTQSELVWLKNPGNLEPSGTGWTNWQQNVLIEQGPDVHFTMHKLVKDGVTFSVIVTGELWTERIMLYYVQDEPGAWSNPDNIGSVVIDAECGTPFEANAYDINADGKLEILASCIKDNEGHLNMYEIPEVDWHVPNWPRRTLAGNFKPSSAINPNSMTPGKFKIFYPSTEYALQTNEDGSPLKPWISLSGDDDGKHYILYPQSEDKNNWQYIKETIIETGAATSGTMAIVDLDGDGINELISSGYSANTVYVHTFKK